MTTDQALPSPYDAFERIVADLFKRLGRQNIRTNVPGNDGQSRYYEIDIEFEDAGEKTAVEVKRYRYSSPPSPNVFARALRQAELARFSANAQNTILVISCRLTDGLRPTAKLHPTVEIWDAYKLLEEAFRYPDLLAQMETVLEVKASEALQLASDSGPGTQAKGESLAKSLREIQSGRADASRFEDRCIESLKYLFNSDLHGWHEQHETEDGLHRRDLVCRILPNAEIWKLMLTTFKSRYVVFEFKNYSEPITQNEIVTTERYLYPSAFRNVAIIISPHGCSESAKRVISGAMREHGKLVLSLTTTELGDVLIGMDQGSDPNAYLFDRVDEFLIGLGR